MAVKYKPIARKNPADQSLPAKYYVTLENSGVVNLDKLAALLGSGSTARKADVYAVLIGLVEQITEQLSEGRMVKMGELGSFSLGVHSEGAESPELVNAQLIKRKKIVFRPSSNLKHMLFNLKFEKKAE